MLHKNILNISRAIDDLKRGVPLTISDGTTKLLVSPIETITNDTISDIRKYSSNPLELIISKTRFTFLSKTEIDSDVITPFTTLESALKISGLELIDTEVEINNFRKITSKIELSVIRLMKLAELVPAALISKIDSTPENIQEITSNEISLFKQELNREMLEVCRTPIALNHADNSSIIAYKQQETAREYYAIIINDAHLQKEPLVRIHSSCYTGDLLASLACDCRDQLHEAIKLMGESKAGGIIIYLMQEGRGIGLINKLRAYQLKENGMDTVDANLFLGFDDDERLFLPAATILKKLGIDKIKLLSNNPKKSKNIEELGITVTQTVSHIIKPNKYNQQYLKTKATRLNHRLPK